MSLRARWRVALRSTRMWRIRLRTRVRDARALRCLSTGRRRVRDASGRVDAVRGRLGRATRPAPHGARASVVIVLTLFVHTTEGKATSAEFGKNLRRHETTARDATRTLQRRRALLSPRDRTRVGPSRDPFKNITRCILMSIVLLFATRKARLDAMFIRLVLDDQKVGTEGGRTGRTAPSGSGTAPPPGTLHASIALYSSFTFSQRWSASA